MGVVKLRSYLTSSAARWLGEARGMARRSPAVQTEWSVRGRGNVAGHLDPRSSTFYLPDKRLNDEFPTKSAQLVVVGHISMSTVD